MHNASSPSATSSAANQPSKQKQQKSSQSLAKGSGGGGGIVLSKLKRKLPTSSSSSSSSSPVQNNQNRSKASGATNALPAEVRARIEAAREAERRRQIEAEAEAQVRTKNVAKAKAKSSAKKSGSKARGADDEVDTEQEQVSSSRKKKKRQAQGSDDEDDLFGSGAEDVGPSTPRKGTSGRATPIQSSGSSGSAYTFLGRSGVVQPYLVPRPPGAATLSEHSSASMLRRPPISSAQLVETAMAKRPKSWGPFFKDLQFDIATGSFPRCVLEYPSQNASEEFILMVARDPDDYDPISDLLRTVYVVVKHYLTPEEREGFGELDEFETGSAAGQIWAGPIVGAQSNGRSLNGADTPVGQVTPTSESAPSTPAHLSAAQANGTPSAPGAHLFSPASGANTPQLESGDALSSVASIIRSFTKSRNRRSGALFLATVERYNELLRSLRAEGSLRNNVHQLVSTTGVPDDLWLRIQDQAYARAVAPRVDELSGYRSFSDNVYGELTPRFMSEISQLCGLRPGKKVLDLGCGVGNLVVQATLQCGCEALGIEAMPAPATLGALQLEEAKTRWTSMWDLAPFVAAAPQDVDKGAPQMNGHGDGGKDEKMHTYTNATTAVWQGDFLEDLSIREHFKSADVLIVNNYAFTPPLNQSLSLLFLDLKDGAQIVSLKPFVPADFRLTQRTVGSSSAILRVEEREYGRGMVSWTERGGKYYIATVDRAALQSFFEGGVDGGAAARDGTSTPSGRKKRRQVAAADDDDDDE